VLLDGAAGIELDGQRERYERDRARALRAADAERRAMAAVDELARQARWIDDRVELPRELLLGPLLAHPTVKWIGFGLDGEVTYISRSKLRATKPVLRRFGDVTAHLDPQGLHFRWHGGKGGLDYYPGRLDWREKQSVLHVPLVRPVHEAAQPAAVGEPRAVLVAPTPPRAPARSPRRSPRARPSGAWLGDILSDLGLLA
jgi:hypothetical protein